MNTLEAVQSIDEGEFEILVAAYLRRRDQRLSHLIQTGVNEQGRSIPCPVDNIILVGGPEPRCVAVASTTIAREALRKKWLGKNGDVPKAINEFRQWRAAYPDISCQLYVATNRLLKSDVQLYRDVVGAGLVDHVTITVIEASALRDFLDYDADGQYIRDTLLTIDAERLSVDLLRAVARQSLDRHQQTFALLHMDPPHEIARDAHTNVQRFLETSPKRLLGLRGPSGTGKSTLLRQIGRAINDNAGIALWAPAEELVVGTSVATLLLNVLRRFYPSLNTRAGDDALKIAAEVPTGLTLLVDDINRIGNPHQALAAINGWNSSTAGKSPNTAHGERTTIHWIVSLWPGQFAAAPDAFGADKQWEFVELGSFSAHERRLFAYTISPSDENHVQHVVNALHGDPFFCGLASLESVVLKGPRRTELIRSIFDRALDRAAVAAQQAPNGRASVGELDAALDTLVGFMLQSGVPEPAWQVIRQALGDSTSSLLIRFAESNQLGWIDKRDGQESWRWKHTRLRDALIGRWLSANVLEPSLDSDIPVHALAWLSDPGLAEAFALSIIYLPQHQHIQALALIAPFQPLALAEVLRLNLFPVETDRRTLIAARLQEALTHYAEQRFEFVEPTQSWVLEKLADTDDPLVLSITQNLKGRHRWWAARLRNGDLAAGLEWIQYESRRDFGFLPNANYPYLEQRLAAFASLHNERRTDIASTLGAAVADPEQTDAALVLASYLRWPELVQPIWEVWDRLPEQQKLDSLADAVWFLSCCEDTSIRPKLETTFLLSLKISDEKRGDLPSSERYSRFVQPLLLSLWRPMQPGAAEAWASIISQHIALQEFEFAAPLLGGIDHPASLEAYIRWKVDRKAWSFWDESVETFDPLADPPYYGPPIVNPDTRGRLWQLSRSDADQKVRLTAFHFWKRAATQDDLWALQSVPIADPLFENVLKVRLKLRDRSASGLLIERMHSDPGSWCGYAPLLAYEPGVFDTLLDRLDAALSGADEDTGRTNWVVQYLPAEQIREVVRRKRDLLLASPGTWPSLWRSDELEALRLFQEAVAQAAVAQEHEHFLEYLFQRGETPHYVSHRMIDALVPIIDQLPTTARRHIADLALHNGFRDWVREYLPDVLTGEAKQRYRWVTEADVMATLDSVAAIVPKGAEDVYLNSDLFGLTITLRERSASAANIMRVLQTWLRPSAGANERTVAAMLTALFGSGDDIGWWKQQEEAMDEELTREVWARTLFVLQRRQWHAASTSVEG